MRSEYFGQLSSQAPAINIKLCFSRSEMIDQMICRYTPSWVHNRQFANELLLLFSFPFKFMNNIVEKTDSLLTLHNQLSVLGQIEMDIFSCFLTSTNSVNNVIQCSLFQEKMIFSAWHIFSRVRTVLYCLMTTLVTNRSWPPKSRVLFL